jgi:Protein of unknown function (DUF4058)
MASPFPGMNPYLEAPELWSEFHSRLIVAIADALDELLSRQYRVAVEKRVYLSQEDEQLLIGIPDVAVMGAQSKTTASQSNSQSTAVVEPLTVELSILEEVQERYLEIREGTTGTVITVIELLSPKNKRAGEGRNAYLQKRQQILSSATHLIEIDLLRAGEPMPMKTVARSPYRILISRSLQRPQAQLYGFELHQPIPPIPVPLQPEKAEPILDLQPLLHHVYDRARFELAIDYRSMPKPKVSPQDWEWLQRMLEAQQQTL